MSTADIASPPLPAPRRDDLRLETVLHALSDPVRLLIVRRLAESPGSELPCGTIPLPVGKSTASHHFRVLREAGVVEQRDQGRQRMTKLRRDDLNARFPGLLDSVLAAA
jgi:DNA-binding transcriptional ArsR family regulator